MVNPIFHQNELKKGLYLVPTPIGNLGDITIRAIEILKKSDFILCEDTRVSKKLLDKFEIKTNLISNHKFNETKNLTKVLNILKDDKLVSLISDAGTPGISDPGAVLINECVKQNINIIPLPGPSAVTTAVSASGFDEKYLFYGFFPEKEKMIMEELEKFSNLNFCIVFFISPKKINKIIPYLNNYFKNRKILICREISKYYEEYLRSDLGNLKLFKNEPKGELTIVVSEKQINKNTSQKISESDKNSIKIMLYKLSTKEITNIISQYSNVSKKEIYETGVSVALDPRTVGTQVDDSIMQKNLAGRILLMDKKYLLSVKTKVLDGRIFLTGKVDNPEEKLKLTKLAWETSGVRSVRNDIKIKEEFNFQQSAKDILITSQLRSAMIFNKNIKATNYQIDTYKKKIYVYGIALTSDERDLVVKEAEEILDVEDVIASIILVDDLRIQKE